jgi:hypothetical protein
MRGYLLNYLAAETKDHFPLHSRRLITKTAFEVTIGTAGIGCLDDATHGLHLVAGDCPALKLALEHAFILQLPYWIVVGAQLAESTIAGLFEHICFTLFEKGGHYAGALISFLAVLLLWEDERLFFEVLCVDISESLEELCTNDEQEVLLPGLPVGFYEDLVVGTIWQ